MIPENRPVSCTGSGKLAVPFARRHPRQLEGKYWLGMVVPSWGLPQRQAKMGLCTSLVRKAALTPDSGTSVKLLVVGVSSSKER
jgi:hypothetical protein